MDSTGHALPNARGTLYNIARVVAAVATTDANGQCSLDLATPGRYLLTVSPIEDEITVTANIGDKNYRGIGWGMDGARVQRDLEVAHAILKLEPEDHG